MDDLQAKIEEKGLLSLSLSLSLSRHDNVSFDPGVEKATAWWIKTLNKSALDCKVLPPPLPLSLRPPSCVCLSVSFVFAVGVSPGRA